MKIISIMTNAKKKENILKVPEVVLGGLLIPRSGSSTSLVSAARTKSVFSNATAKALEVDEGVRQGIIKARRKESEYFTLIEREVEIMTEQSERQKNIGMPIKEGPKNIKSWVEQMKEKHEEGDRMKNKYQRSISFTEEATN